MVTVAKPVKPSAPLKGKELLTKVKSLKCGKLNKAIECGYVKRVGKTQRANLSGFLNAIIEAEGIQLDPEVKGRRGKEAQYRIKVQSNRTLLIGAAYTKQLELEPGDEFEIVIGRKHIQLRQVEQ